MGWQQYSRPLWLSRVNHYILYLKAITARMPTSLLFFPQQQIPWLTAAVMALQRLLPGVDGAS